jgi:hypothetical protein
MTDEIFLFQLEDLRLKLLTAQSRLSSHERRKSLAMDMDESGKEEVLAKNDELREENERLKKYVCLVQKRHKKESEKRAKQMEEMASEAANRERENERLNEALEEQTSTAKFLRYFVVSCNLSI